MNQMQRIPCTIMRGGTSKGIFIMDKDLPVDPGERERVILKVFGSPDIRQIDGLGGAEPLTSKLAIIAPSSRPDADIDYTFQQVGINDDFLGRPSTCGNILSAVGPFAMIKGLVGPGQAMTTVRIQNMRTGRLIVAEVPTVDREPAVYGDYAIAGVPGTGAKITLDFTDSVGAITGKLLPTGRVREELDVPGFKKVEASIVDAGNPVVFLRAADLGLTGLETPPEVDDSDYMVKLLETIRAMAAVRCGLASGLEEARRKTPAIPMLAFLAKPGDYTGFVKGETIPASSMDFAARMMFMQIMHKAYAGSASISTACAARIPGTIVHEFMDPSNASGLVRIGHPSGVMAVESAAEERGGETVITRVANHRTARLIMDGTVFIRR